LVLTDEGRIGEGQGWASLITPNGGVLAQTHYEAKLTEAAISADLIALGCRDGHLYGLALADLKERWRFKVPGQGDGISVAHPYHVAAGGDFVWVSYMSTCWAIDRTSGRQVLRKELDVPTGLVALPDGTLATTIYKGLALVTPKGSVKLTEVKEPNPRIYGLDAARGRIVAGRWGQGEDWYVFDFSGRVVQQAKLGPCDHAELSDAGYLAIQLRDAVSISGSDLERIGLLRQPEVTGNRVRAMGWASDGVLWVSGKGLWKVRISG
jgi:outer membrane protein assembly factor BamB